VSARPLTIRWMSAETLSLIVAALAVGEMTRPWSYDASRVTSALWVGPMGNVNHLNLTSLSTNGIGAPGG
jgi:hypothetical protein